MRGGAHLSSLIPEKKCSIESILIPFLEEYGSKRKRKESKWNTTAATYRRR
jgi:hypothetical protein